MTTKDELLDHTPLEFGKYKGRTPDQVADIDPSYVVWMWENVVPKRCSRILADACMQDVLENEESFPSDFMDND